MSIPESYTCETHGDYPTENRGSMQWDCPACRTEANAVEREWRQEWNRYWRWEGSGLPRRFQSRTLDNWTPRTASDASKLEAARAWINGLQNNDGTGLLLLGGVGLGKTHMAAGLITGAVLQTPMAPRYGTAADLFGSIRRCFDRKGNDQQSADEVFDDIRSADLLVIDEVGVTMPTEWERGKLFELIDYRYSELLPFVLVSNTSPSQLPRLIGERTADRLNECAVTLQFAGKSRREDVAVEQSHRSAPPAIKRPPECIEAVICRSGTMTKMQAEIGNGRLL